MQWSRVASTDNVFMLGFGEVRCHNLSSILPLNIIVYIEETIKSQPAAEGTSRRIYEISTSPSLVSKCTALE